MSSSHHVSTLSRSGPAVAVIGIHLLIAYVLSVSMGVFRVSEVPRAAEVTFIPDAQPQKPDPIEPIEPNFDVRLKPFDHPMPRLPDEPVAPIADVPMPSSPSAPIATEPTRAGAGPSLPVAQPLKVSRRVEPLYPPSARRAGEAGSVQLRILVDERGVPGEVQIAKSSGFARLDDAAVQAVRRWRFIAATNGNDTIAAWTQIAITFQLTQ